MGVTLTQEMINGAIETQTKYKVPASVTLAQIMLESGGNYPGGLSGLAYNDNNLFGIKAGSNWKGDTATYSTQEHDGNNYYTVKQKFRKYSSIKESIDDHGKLLSSSTYTNKTAGATNLTEYVKAMGSVYATSPTYASNLLSVIKSNNLDKYDTGVFPTGSVSVGSSSQNTVTASPTSSGYSWFDNILTNIIKITFIILILVLGIIFLLKAFNFSPSEIAQKVVIKTVKSKTGVDVEKLKEGVTE